MHYYSSFVACKIIAFTPSLCNVTLFGHTWSWCIYLFPLLLPRPYGTPSSYYSFSLTIDVSTHSLYASYVQDAILRFEIKEGNYRMRTEHMQGVGVEKVTGHQYLATYSLRNFFSFCVWDGFPRGKSSTLTVRWQTWVFISSQRHSYSKMWTVCTRVAQRRRRVPGVGKTPISLHISCCISANTIET